MVGSINYDLIISQQRLPRRGETLAADSFRGDFGGKGANQAMQAARLGAAVRFIGATGADHYGRLCSDNLQEAGITCRLRPTSAPNGLGIVHVVGQGEVYATIVEGANAEVTESWIDDSADFFEGVGLVVLQNEVPISANERAVQLATAAGIPVLYNAAPARPVSRELTRACAWLIVNEDEAASYLGRDLGQVDDDAAMRLAVRELRSWCDDVILTLGSRGCYVAAGLDVEFVPAVATFAVDTTGAGDSFIGAFAAAIVDGAAPFDAARGAARVASITVEGVGAQSSMPTREALQSEIVRQAPAHPRPGRAG
ncbi:ribokinase (plasmid) [Rathayibacter sp. VKM Ac-2803]|nr:ribokinase [Rathayibacter sp. VKM Ac-2803]